MREHYHDEHFVILMKISHLRILRDETKYTTQVVYISINVIVPPVVV